MRLLENRTEKSSIFMYMQRNVFARYFFTNKTKKNRSSGMENYDEFLAYCQEIASLVASICCEEGSATCATGVFRSSPFLQPDTIGISIVVKICIPQLSHPKQVVLCEISFFLNIYNVLLAKSYYFLRVQTLAIFMYGISDKFSVRWEFFSGFGHLRPKTEESGP